MARDREFKSRDKKTHRMTRDGLVEVNQTTGEQERISLRGAEFQLRQSESSSEAMPLREQPHTGRSRQQARPLDFQQEPTNPDQRYDTQTAGAGFDTTPADSLPRQSSDVPVTGSPGHSSAAALESTRPYHTEGGRLREDAHRPDTPTPEHRQSGSGYYQQFQEAPAPEQYATESALFSQIESPAANTNADVQASVSAESAAEPPATLRQTDDLPLAPKPVNNHAVREVPVDAPLSGDSDAAPPMPERLGRLRFDGGTTSTAQKKQRQSGTKYAQKFAQDAEPESQKTAAGSANHSTSTTESSAPEPDGSTTPESDSGTAPPPGKKSSRLQFGAEELPPGDALDRKISKLQGKIGKTEAKLKKAQEHLPTKRKLRAERTFDTEKGKPQRKIRFEQEVKSQREHLKGALPTPPGQGRGKCRCGHCPRQNLSGGTGKRGGGGGAQGRADRRERHSPRLPPAQNRALPPC